jgi:hypothetical protein
MHEDVHVGTHLDQARTNMAFGLREALDLAFAAFEIVRVIFRHGPKIGTRCFRSTSKVRKKLRSINAPTATNFYANSAGPAAITNRLRCPVHKEGGFVNCQPFPLRLWLTDEPLHKLAQTNQFRKQVVD